jgi:hypothetical protein
MLTRILAPEKKISNHTHNSRALERHSLHIVKYHNNHYKSHKHDKSRIFAKSGDSRSRLLDVFLVLRNVSRSVSRAPAHILRKAYQIREP